MRRISLKIDNLKIDLGCGQRKKDGFIGIDKDDYGQEIVWDLSLGIPLPDKSVSEIYSSHFFEHLTYPDINTVLWEVKRVAAEGCIMTVVVPDPDFQEANDIAHYTYWTETYFRGLFNSLHSEILELYKKDRAIWAKIKV